MSQPVPPAPGASERQPDQAAVFLLYRQLREGLSGGTLAGRLVLSLGFSAAGAELALATMIAQGCFLGLEPDMQSLKQAVRSGACDFMVNTLDEALRVLKNELRKKTPLSVGLLGAPQPILDAIVARGVQPDLIAGARTSAAVQTLAERGATLLPDVPSTSGSSDSLTRVCATTPGDMRRLDALLAGLVEQSPIQAGWIQHAPAYFSRRLPPQRVLDLSQAQTAVLQDQLDAASRATSFEGALTVESPHGTVTFRPR